jgi:Ca2+-binding EF-hand superfamily protein
VRSALKAHFHGLRELFAAVDADGSGGLDGEELADICSRLGITMSADEVAAALKEMDTDGDGTADFREFNAWYKRVRSRPEEGVPSAAAARASSARGIIEKAAGPIVLDGHDYAEILDELEGEDLLICAREEHCAVPPDSPPAAVRSALKAHFHGLGELFAAVDADGSGGLDGEELADICSRLGITMSADEVAAALKEMDTDGDGTADFREFNAWYKRVRSRPEEGVPSAAAARASSAH